MQKIYILLPVHNRSAVTARFIDCLAAQTCPEYHLILIDDGSTDGTELMVRSRIGSLTVIRGRGNWWWAGCLQQGINWLERHGVADGDIVLFANDDITFTADFLQKAARILAPLSATLLLPQLIDEKTGLPQESGVEADLQRLTFHTATSADRINCLPTRGLFMRMSDLRKIGNFHPRLLPHYLSDYEFTIRAHRKGLRLVTSADIAIGLDREQTGFRSLEEQDFTRFVRRYFSKRHTANPVYWSAFVILAAPKARIPAHLYNLWRAAAKLLLQHGAGSLRKQWRKSK